MLVDFRCGQCRKLLARITPASELQIKCGRCRTLNHVNATSVEPSPASDPLAECSADPTDSNGECNHVAHPTGHSGLQGTGHQHLGRQCG
ncbi:Com family DNA-binding transcriptional regulator [Pseudomonas sp. S75]|nr:Com family DNA-binding transcriptional regulator [Pseudomonas sp. S30]MBK0155417.1 Com family DNA-binding transcriptional regulator [Pseudomonas sp. S75]